MLEIVLRRNSLVGGLSLAPSYHALLLITLTQDTVYLSPFRYSTGVRTGSVLLTAALLNETRKPSTFQNSTNNT